MRRRPWPLLAATLLLLPTARAQEAYQQPPAPIAQILDAPPTPLVRLSPDRAKLLLMERRSLPTIAELSEPELGLAGNRINPRTNGPSRSMLRLSGLSVQDVAGGEPRRLDTPAGAAMADADWSPDGATIAFTVTEKDGIALWVADVATGHCRALTPARLNQTAGAGFDWMPDGKALLASLVPEGRGPAPKASDVPTGPVVQETAGRAAPSRTYQDLLASPADEALYEHYFTSQLTMVPLEGDPKPVGPAGIHAGVSPSPDGKYLLVQTIHRPYSYLVPEGRFPTRIEVWDRDGKVVHTLADRPLQEGVPIAFDSTIVGPRAVQWRADAPATLAWVEALDGGDPAKDVPRRDVLRTLAAPFEGKTTDLFASEYRMGGVTWGRGDLAVASERRWKSRRERTWVLAPDHPDRAPRVLFDRSSEDRYGDPGGFLTRTLPNGRRVLQTTGPGGMTAYLSGGGASPEGDRPFLDRIDLASGKTDRLFRSEAPYLEDPVAPLDDEATRLIIRRESVDDPPNYFVRNLKDGTLRALTNFPDPAPQLAGLKPELIRYRRADGVELSGMLYLPPGYDKSKGPLPFVLWAYPREFKSAAAASQVSGSPYNFTRPGGSSHLFLLTQGYGILDGPAMPIVGDGDAEPNDTYVEQLVASAKAAVEALVERGLAERGRVAVGGHSYGAFMTANLLAHSDLFAAGIARSGAYNRTLTPFGFQAEERPYWQAREIYTRMSPFTYADKIKTPILMIHGQADNNPGTFTVQSERLYAAIKGNGGTARLVLLPAESHGYAARESVGHTLWEMARWLDEHVKNRSAGDSATAK
jgi:dipeptidyl aminopeptidase/acylaminoacyl peptidase